MPLGCQRKGQSRFWSADQGYWQIGVEFQPSAWSQGSYLNVGVQWPWLPKAYFSFGMGVPTARVADFISFENEEQFKPEADRLAACAAKRVRELQHEFRSFRSTVAALDTRSPKSNLDLYNLAVATGLAGRLDMAGWLLAGLQGDDAGWPEREPEASSVARLLAYCNNPPDFLNEVAALVAECRALKKLPPDVGVRQALEAAKCEA